MRRLLLCVSIILSVSGLRAEEATPGQTGQDARAFPQAIKPRTFEFPRDYGSHPAYKTEWWYLTGALETQDGEAIGFQATWFRTRLEVDPPARESKLATKQLYFFHGAMTDVARDSFVYDQAASRGASTWAGAKEGDLHVFLLGRELKREADGSWRLAFKVKDRALELTLTPRRAPLLHGKSPGLSQKGPRPGQASYYASHARMKTTGTVRREAGGPAEKVTGLTWFDQEFGSNQLDESQIGWDWVSVPLDDGSDLMLYAIRKKDGSVEPHSSGTLRKPDGTRVHLPREDFAIEVLEHWTSPHTQGKYPARWKLRVPKHGVELTVTPLRADQELRTRESTGVNYWEGLCQYEGNVGDKKVRGRGYVELVGYAGAFIAGI